MNDINASERLVTWSPLRLAAERSKDTNLFNKNLNCVYLTVMNSLKGNLKMVKLLVENGAKNGFGDTVRDFAEKNQHWRVVDYLELAGNKTNPQGKTKHSNNLLK